MKTNLKWIIVFAVFCTACIGIMFLRNNAKSGSVAQIKQGNTVIKTVDLSKIDEPYEEKIEDGHGGYNIIRFENGRVAVTDANCPDKVCIHQGTIREGDIVPVTCLPNRLSLQIISEKSIPNGFDLKKQDYDSVRK